MIGIDHCSIRREGGSLPQETPGELLDRKHGA